MKSDETQTDTVTLGNLGTVETQSEVVEMQDAKIQVSELAEMKLCVGNHEEKFLPLVTKHKGVFKDVTGLYVKYSSVTFACTIYNVAMIQF